MKFSEYRERHARGELDLQVSVPREARGIQGQRAGFLARLLAVAIDIGLVILLIIVINGVVALLNIVLDRISDIALPQLTQDFAVGALLVWAMWAVGWWSTGRSIGDYVMGLRVVDRHGDNPSFPLAALRAIFCFAFPVGLFWVLVSGQNRSLQDIVLRTSVINDWVMGLPTLSRRGSPSAR